MANTVGLLKPELGRQARAALVMDRMDLTFDGKPSGSTDVAAHGSRDA
jgi:hypothetical protein